MTVITLTEALAKTQGALAGLVCLGWEEVRAYIEAAEAVKHPVILMVGPGARANMPLEIWGKMLRFAAEASSADLVLHLDHGRQIDDVKRAIDVGFSSVMFDGSALPLSENIAKTKEMVELAKGLSTEGEIGYVGYQNGENSMGTDVKEAEIFARETGVDMMAVSVGNTHLQTKAGAQIDWARLEKLASIGAPLVIHGGSGVHPDDRARMTREFNTRKFNIGTEVRQEFGRAIRNHLDQNPDDFDHLNILRSVHEPIVKATKHIIKNLGN